MDAAVIALTTAMATSWFTAVLQVFLMTAFKLRARKRRQMLEWYIKRARRRRCRRTIAVMLTLLTPKPRRIGFKRQTSTDWWDNTVPKFSEREWMDNFRMRKQTFEWICGKLFDILKPHPKPVIKSQPLSVEKTVAIALYKLSHVGEYLMVANQFGVCKTTVHNCLYAFCYALVHTLADELIKFPDATEAEEISKHFQGISHIPQIIGSIDGTHIPITPPLEGNADYVCRKMYPSMILQAIVDHNYLFRDISCIVPGSSHDRDALHESTFYKHRETLMPKGFKLVDGKIIPYMLLGDPAYPLETWLKNYSYDKNTSPYMDSFNVYMNKSRVFVENAFGRLKSRWRILCRKSDVAHTFVPTMVAACCILHNICELSKEKVRREWQAARLEDECDYPPVPTEDFNEEDQYAAVDLRDHLMLHLAHTQPLLTSSRGRAVAP